jgi:phage shock protein A
MRLIKRVNAILTAQLNDIVDTFEKPERMLKQAIREMEAALESATESTARAIAAEKRLRRERADAQAQAETWHGRAIPLVQKGDDAAARQALARKAEKQKLAESLGRELLQSEATTGQLRRQLDVLRGRLADAKRHLAALVARQRAAEARKQFVQALGNFDTDLEAFRRFEDLSERIDATEAEVDARCELQGADFDDPGLDPHVESELAILKEKSLRAAEPDPSNRGESS